MDAGNDTDPTGTQTGWAVGIEDNIMVRIVYALIASIGTAGNFLVCFVLIRVPPLRSRASQMIIHLSITDLITCLWVVPFHLFPSTPRVPHGFLGEVICRVFVSKYLLWVTIVASIYSLLSVNLERFVAIVYPLVYRKTFTFKKSVVIYVMCWVVGTISNTWFFLNFDYDPESQTCVFVPFTREWELVVGVYVFILIYVFPITFNTVAHFYMIKTLKQKLNVDRQRTTGRNGNGGLMVPSSNGSLNRGSHGNWKMKTAHDLEKMLFVVVVTFIVCWAPNQIIFFLYRLGAPIDFTRWYYHVSVMLALCNSCINPFIYTFKHKPFRSGLLKSLGLKAQSVTPFPGSSTDHRTPLSVRGAKETDVNI